MQAIKAVSVVVVVVLGAGRGRGVLRVWGPASNYEQLRQYPDKISVDHGDSVRDYSFTQPFERWASPTDAIDIRYAMHHRRRRLEGSSSRPHLLRMSFYVYFEVTTVT